jgi:hypothetical protein
MAHKIGLEVFDFDAEARRVFDAASQFVNLGAERLTELHACKHPQLGWMEGRDSEGRYLRYGCLACGFFVHDAWKRPRLAVVPAS